MLCLCIFSLKGELIICGCSRVSTTSGNLEFLIPPGNTGNILGFHWPSSKFLTDGMTTKTSSHKKFISSPVVWKMVYISHDGCV